jgi:(2Fe-2S) ferredoxin
MGFSVSKTHPLWYADVRREAKKEIVDELCSYHR